MIKIIRLIFATAIFLGLTGLIFQTFYVSDKSNSSLVNTPVQSIRLENQVKANILLEDMTEPVQISNDLREILKLRPLSDKALFLHAQSQLVQGAQVSANLEVYKTVRARNPRNRANLRKLLASSFQIGDLLSAIETLDLLFRLTDKDDRDQIITLFSALYDMPEGREIIDNRLANTPVWGWRFLRVQSLSSPPENIEWVAKSLVSYLKASSDVVALFPQVEVVSRKLVDNGEINKAYDLWKLATERAEDLSLEETTLNFNPKMRKLISPPPFNWQFSKDAGVTIEQSPDQTFISYRGARKKTVASQYFFPKANSIKIVAQANYRASKQHGSFVFSVECLELDNGKQNIDTGAFKKSGQSENRETLAGRTHVLRLTERFKSGERQAHNLEGFDNRCELGVLSLIAEPGIYNERLSATFNYVGIVPDTWSQEIGEP